MGERFERVPIVLTAPLTEGIDHAGFFIQMSQASIPGRMEWANRGDTLAIDRFGASAPTEVLLEKCGFTLDHVVARAKDLPVVRHSA